MVNEHHINLKQGLKMKNINSNINIKTLIQQGKNIKQYTSINKQYDTAELEKLICSSLSFLESEHLTDTYQYKELVFLLENFKESEYQYNRIMGVLLSCEQMYF